MADPVVHITNGLPDSGTGNITTLGQTLTDGANATLGITTGTAVVTDVAGTVQQYLRGAVKLLAAGITVANSAGSAIIGKFSMVDSGGTDATDTTNHALRVNVVAGAGSGGTALADEAAFTEGTTSITPIGGVFKTSHTALTTGQAGVLALTAAREASVSVTSTALDTNIGNASSKTQRVAICSDQLSALATTALPMSSGYQLVATPTDQVVPLKVQAIANGSTSSRVTASVTTNTNTNLKASAGNITEIDVFNVAAYTVFLKFYNKASAPTVGTDTPVWTIPIAAGTGYSKSFKYGKSFATGIGFGITKLQADSDTTALAAGDLIGSIDWI